MIDLGWMEEMSEMTLLGKDQAKLYAKKQLHGRRSSIMIHYQRYMDIIVVIVPSCITKLGIKST